MSKELEALEVSKQLKEFVLGFVKNGLDRRFIHGSFDIIETTLKALEIIKDKEVNVHFLLVCMHDFSNNDEVGREEYNKQEGSYWHTANALTQEEYGLLNEVLK